MLQPSLSCQSPKSFFTNSPATPGPKSTQTITAYSKYSIFVMRLSPSRNERSILLYLSEQIASCTASFVSTVSIFSFGGFSRRFNRLGGFLHGLNKLEHFLVRTCTQVAQNLVCCFNWQLQFHVLLCWLDILLLQPSTHQCMLALVLGCNS